MGAVLACGPGAMLSHQSAAELWGIRLVLGGPIHVSIALGARRKRRGIALHRRAPLRHARCRGIPVTTVVDTLIDIAPSLSRDELEAAINAAVRRKLIGVRALRAALDDVAPRPGLKKLRATLDRATFVYTDSWLERRFLPIARRAGLTRLVTQRYFGTNRVDFFDPETGMVVETDGFTDHHTPFQQAVDNRRNSFHAAEGRVPLRFSHGQIMYEPAYVEETLRNVAERLRGAREVGRQAQ
jgi:very-short-patch-repair endonuclease